MLCQGSVGTQQIAPFWSTSGSSSSTVVIHIMARWLAHINKWQGAPRYGKGILGLPLARLTEKFTYAKAKLEMMLSESRNIPVWCTVPTVSAGCKWNPRKEVYQAQAAFSRDIIGSLDWEYHSLHEVKQQQLAEGNWL